MGRDESFKALTKKMLENLGATHLDDEKAMDKIVSKLVCLASGLKLSRKNMELKERSKNDIKETMLLAVIMVLEERGIISINEDGSFNRL